MYPTQKEADELLNLPKHRTVETPYPFLIPGLDVRIPLESRNPVISFMLDTWRSSISLSRIKYQNRVYKNIVLARLDFGHRHENPDGDSVPEQHIHLYREGYNDKFALPLPYGPFPNEGTYMHFYEIFLRFCNIVTPPLIQLNPDAAAWGYFP